jgi:hypothetical protein
MRIFERLNFTVIRVIAVSQGIDSKDEQVDVLVTVDDLMDSLYVDQEAIIVRRIFEMSANSAALKTIAKTLNAEGIPSPRARVGRVAPG